MSDEAALIRIARVLLQQVKRGGPSNFEQVADRYLANRDVEVFERHVAGVDPDAAG